VTFRRPRVAALGFRLFVFLAVVLGWRGVARADELRIAPSPSGAMGAWLVVGPFRRADDPMAMPPRGVDEKLLDPAVGRTVGPPFEGARSPKKGPSAPPKVPTWTLAASGDGPVDVKGALASTDSDVIAYAGGILHVPVAGPYFFVVGADDGMRITVDDTVLHTRDDARPFRDADDVVATQLSAGDHRVLLKLHQRSGAWSFRFRVVGRDLRPVPGTYLRLPGTAETDAGDLMGKMSWVSLDRGAGPGGYRPKLTVRYPEGAPMGRANRVRVRLARKDGEGRARFDDTVGQAPVWQNNLPTDLLVNLPELVDATAEGLDDRDYLYGIDVGGRHLDLGFFPRRVVRAASDRALDQVERWRTQGTFTLTEGVLESLEHGALRLRAFVSRGDADVASQVSDAKDLDALVGELERGTDPYRTRTGPMRRALVSPLDGALEEFGMYVPPSYRPDRPGRYPLIVVLHGLNGKPLAMLRWFFGGDDPQRDQDWEDRHWGAFDPLEAFVVAPFAHGNSMYREFGEGDVLRIINWTLATYPVDRSRISITGPSMGGIGAAAIAFRVPDLFAAAAPLCGYHSYFVRRDVQGKTMRPWERLLAEERSNVFWADNGKQLPLFVVHGTEDLPVENSAVLVQKYEDLRYEVEHEEPALGHNVWQTTYADQRAAKWLLSKRRGTGSRNVRFRTVRLRNGSSGFVHIDEMARPDAWADVDVVAESRTRIVAKTAGVTAMHFDRDGMAVDQVQPVTIVIDGATIRAPAGASLNVVRGPAGWSLGLPVHNAPFKSARISGPIRDAFHGPLLFVYGASDPEQTVANQEVAKAFAEVRPGVTLKYPVISDREFFERGEEMANDRGLFLIGNAKSNRLVREFEPSFPIRIVGSRVTVGAATYDGNELGAAFIRPNPLRPDRYVVVVAGVDAAGTYRALSLPDLLPDFVVWDRSVAPARGQMILGGASLRAAGFFGNDWGLPGNVASPN
jgi:predicted esterase